MSGRRKDDPLAVLSPREIEVLALMAEGRSNAGVSRQLWVTEGTVEKHVRSILDKLNLPEADDNHRRVLAEGDLEDAIAASPALGFIPKVALSAGAIRRLVDGPGGD